MKTILGWALVITVVTLVLTPDADAAARRRWRYRRGYENVPAAATTAQSTSGYRTYSYEPGSVSNGNGATSRPPVPRAFRDAAYKATGGTNY
jgi:hypothetical protein